MELQRSAGNAAVSSVLAPLALQREEGDEPGFFDGVAAEVSEMAGAAVDFGSQSLSEVGQVAEGAVASVTELASGGVDAASQAADAAGEAQRQQMVAQLKAVGRGIPAAGIQFTPEELDSLNAQFAQLATLTGGSVPAVAAVGAAPALAPTLFDLLIAALTAAAEAILALTLAEFLLIAAAILAIILLIILLFKTASGRPTDVPKIPGLDFDEDKEKEKEKEPKDQKKPEEGPTDPPPPPIPRLPRVEFGPVRAANTPKPMPDRLPDGGLVPVRVKVTGWDPSMGPITVVANGQGAGGTVKVDGDDHALITGDTTSLDVAGDQQTAANKGTPLQLSATLGATVVGQSAGFAVAAIMEDMTAAFADTIDDASVGVLVNMSWRSDGRSIGSLGEIEFEEQLQVEEETGCFTGVGEGGHGGLLSGSVMPALDKHSSAREVVKRGPGRQVVQQVWGFLDNRTGSIGMAVRNSGYVITREVFEDPNQPGSLTFVLRKVGRAGSARGHSSAAGSGAAEATIAL